MVAMLREVLSAGYPFFGICFGNQLLGRALGFGTYKLKFGHRGINQPGVWRTSSSSASMLRGSPWPSSRASPEKMPARITPAQVYIGEPYGAVGATRGEIVFSTAMTGYQETLTNVVVDGSTTTRQPRSARRCGVIALMPRSTAATVATGSLPANAPVGSTT